jgi:hypothetical protein
LYNVVHVVQESAGMGIIYMMEKFGRAKEEITKT